MRRLAGLILAFALLMAATGVRSFVERVIFVTLLGLLPWIVVDFSNWNWYGFPFRYQISQLLDQGVGAVLAGVALALIFRKD